MIDPANDPTRARDLKVIHAARRQMALTDDTYRAILERVTGKTSAAELTARQRKAVLDDFARLGWDPRKLKNHRAPNATPNPNPAEPDLPLTGMGWGKDRQISKIGALLADAGRGWAYADGIARNMFGYESVRFCDAEQLRKIIAALTYDQQRRRRGAPTPPEAA